MWDMRCAPYKSEGITVEVNFLKTIDSTLIFRFAFLLLGLIFLFPTYSQCQQDTASIKSDTVKLKSDSLKIYTDSSKVVPDSNNHTQPALQDTLKKTGKTISDTGAVADTTKFHRVKESYAPFKPTKSGWLAIGLSAGLPGAGQVYDESYWKVPVIWGLAGYWIYEWSFYNKSYKSYQDQYNKSVILDPPNGLETLQKQRDAERDYRDQFAWYLGILYFVNIVDAYVGANLYDFEVTPDLSSSPSHLRQFGVTIHHKF